MICTNCYEAEYRTARTELAVIINGKNHVLANLECEACPACGEVTFTHDQSVEIGRKRIALLLNNSDPCGCSGHEAGKGLRHAEHSL